LTDNNGLT